MENHQQDGPFKDTTPAAPIESVPESASTPESPQESEGPFDDPQSLDEDDRVLEGDHEPPARNDEDPGDDPNVPNEAAPEQVPVESIEADQTDDKGSEV